MHILHIIDGYLVFTKRDSLRFLKLLEFYLFLIQQICELNSDYIFWSADKSLVDGQMLVRVTPKTVKLRWQMVLS